MTPSQPRRDFDLITAPSASADPASSNHQKTATSATERAACGSKPEKKWRPESANEPPSGRITSSPATATATTTNAAAQIRLAETRASISACKPKAASNVSESWNQSVIRASRARSNPGRLVTSEWMPGTPNATASPMQARTSNGALRRHPPDVNSAISASTAVTEPA